MKMQQYKLVTQHLHQTLDEFNREITSHLNDGEYQLVGGPVRWGHNESYWAQALVRNI